MPYQPGMLGPVVGRFANRSRAREVAWLLPCAVLAACGGDVLFGDAQTASSGEPRSVTPAFPAADSIDSVPSANDPHAIDADMPTPGTDGAVPAPVPASDAGSLDAGELDASAIDAGAIDAGADAQAPDSGGNDAGDAGEDAGDPCPDGDGDGTGDCNDACPNDGNKLSAGACGCGTPDTNSDSDPTPDCHDACPNDGNKLSAGACGCGTPDTNSDADPTPDCHDACPNDGNKLSAGACGCGTPDTDGDGNSVPDCLEDDVTRVCSRWNADRANLSEGTWNGAVASCNAGDMDAAWRARTLLQVNLYRWLAGLPAVSADATRNAKAQQCALMMDANNALSHSPPMTWNCYTADGAEAAGRSNIATTAAVQAVDLYMIDPGNATTLGHRRWILSNSLGPIGIGSTSEDSCLWVLQGTGDADMPWTAWPPPGVFPIEAAALPWSNLNQTGLSIQSDTINLGAATVAIDDGATGLATTKTTLLSGYGSQYAISLVPSGWTLTAGKTYHVDVTGIASPFSYELTVADCEP